MVFDYASLGLTRRRHPMEILRPHLAGLSLMTAEELRQAPDRRVVKTCGIVTTRQQPETSKGMTFISLDDGTGDVQVPAQRLPEH